MKKFSRLACALALLWTTSTAVLAEQYDVDPAHSSLSFSIEHAGLTHIDGRFTEFNGAIHFDPKAPDKTTIEFTAQSKSVNTDVAKRDEHLRTADFFDVEKYPTLSFKSSKVKALGSDRYQVEGQLTAHGQTKTITTVAYIVGPKEVMGAQKVGFRTTFDINRLDFKIGDGPNYSADAMLSHKVNLEIKGEAAVKK